MDELVRNLRNNVGGIITLLVTLGVMSTCVVVVILPGDRKVEAWVRERACTIAQGQNNSSPFGAVRSCRLLDYDPRLFHPVDASTWLLLETDLGLVVVRVDYLDLDMGRQWKADAVELSPDDVPGGMSDEEIGQHQRDVEGRGGILDKPWRLVYGDG